MLGFARNIVFVGENGGSVAEKSCLARATVPASPLCNGILLDLRAQWN